MLLFTAIFKIKTKKIDFQANFETKFKKYSFNLGIGKNLFFFLFVFLEIFVLGNGFARP